MHPKSDKNKVAQASKVPANQEGTSSTLFSTKYDVVKSFKSSSTFLVKSRKDKKLYIGKSIILAGVKEDERQKALKEIRIMKSLRHPNVISLKEHFVEEKELILVMEYCEEGDLAQLIQTKKERKHHFEEKLLLNWLLQMLFGLEFIHSNKILHRDISKSNIFLTAKGSIKIGNFSVAKELDHTQQVLTTIVGTPNYFSPEQCENQAYTWKTDLWALGCVLYELCALKLPFEGRSLMELVGKIVKDTPEPIPKSYSPSLRGLIEKLLSKSPKERPQIREIIAEKFMVETMRDFIKSRGAIADAATLGIVKLELEKKLSTENEDRLRIPKNFVVKAGAKARQGGSPTKVKVSPPNSDEGRYGRKAADKDIEDRIVEEQETSRTEPKTPAEPAKIIIQQVGVSNSLQVPGEGADLSKELSESKTSELTTSSLKKSALPTASQVTHNESNVSCNLSLTMDSVLLAKNLGGSNQQEHLSRRISLDKPIEERKSSLDIDKMSEDLSQNLELEEREDFDGDSFDEAEILVKNDNEHTSMEEVLEVYKSQLFMTSGNVNLKFINGLEIISEASFENSSRGTFKQD